MLAYQKLIDVVKHYLRSNNTHTVAIVVCVIHCCQLGLHESFIAVAQEFNIWLLDKEYQVGRIYGIQSLNENNFLVAFSRLDNSLSVVKLDL